MNDVLRRLAVVGLPEPPAPNTFDPVSFNDHYVRVRNPNGPTSDDGWQRLTVQ